jgi:hypothetical protein
MSPATIEGFELFEYNAAQYPERDTSLTTEPLCPPCRAKYERQSRNPRSIRERAGIDTPCFECMSSPALWAMRVATRSPLARTVTIFPELVGLDLDLTVDNAAKALEAGDYAKAGAVIHGYAERQRENLANVARGILECLEAGDRFTPATRKHAAQSIRDALTNPGVQEDAAKAV